MDNRNKVLVVLLLLMLCFFPIRTQSASAENLPYIQDDADLLTKAEEQALYEDMLPICEYGVPMFWTTNESGAYYSMARNFYHNRLGKGTSGTLFVINMNARQLTVFSDGTVYRVVTAGEADTITDNVFRLAGREEYYACAASVFRQIHSLLQGEKIARPMKLISNLLLSAALSLLCIYIYLSRRYENHPKTSAAKAAVPVTAVAAASFAAQISHDSARMTKQHKSSISSGSGGGGGHGGGFSGGGGGSSGGGGSHGF